MPADRFDDSPRPSRPFRVAVTRVLPAPGTAPLIASGFDVVQHESDRPPTAGQLAELAGHADGLLCLLTERVDAGFLDAAPRLRIVANLAVGHDNIDKTAAAARGVVVTNTPDVLTDATADLAWALILAAARRVGEGERLLRSGAWQGWSPTQLVGQAVGGHGRTLGVVGLGAIGFAVARRAAGFEMPVVYTSRSAKPEAEIDLRGRLTPEGIRRVDLDELLAVADVVSLHVPYGPETHHLIDARRLALLKPSAVLVNTSRGAVVDEAALVIALRNGSIAAAGLDVFEREPALHPGLADLANVVLLPHIGSATTDTRARMVELACANIAAVLTGHAPLTPVLPV